MLPQPQGHTHSNRLWELISKEFYREREHGLWWKGFKPYTFSGGKGLTEAFINSKGGEWDNSRVESPSKNKGLHSNLPVGHIYIPLGIGAQHRVENQTQRDCFKYDLDLLPS